MSSQFKPIQTRQSWRLLLGYTYLSYKHEVPYYCSPQVDARSVPYKARGQLAFHQKRDEAKKMPAGAQPL